MPLGGGVIQEDRLFGGALWVLGSWSRQRHRGLYGGDTYLGVVLVGGTCVLVLHWEEDGGDRNLAWGLNCGTWVSALDSGLEHHRGPL